MTNEEVKLMVFAAKAAKIKVLYYVLDPVEDYVIYFIVLSKSGYQEVEWNPFVFNSDLNELVESLAIDRSQYKTDIDLIKAAAKIGESMP